MGTKTNGSLKKNKRIKRKRKSQTEKKERERRGSLSLSPLRLFGQVALASALIW